MIEADQIESITAADVRSSDDEKVGSVGQVFLDAQTGRPEWAAVRTGFFGTKEAFVPLRNAEWDGRVVRVAYDKERVKNAPHVDPDNRGLDPDQQVELYTYYGFTETTPQPQISRLESATTTAAPSSSTAHHGETAGATSADVPLASYRDDRTATSPIAAVPVATPAAAPPGESLSAAAMSELDSHDDTTAAESLPTGSLSAIAMSELADRDESTSAAVASDSSTEDADGGAVTRMEEHLEVGVEQHATERVRLRKHIVTQVETVTVTLRREELRIERVPITGDEAASAGRGATIGESETEIVLYEERPVVTTVARPVERIRLTREVVTDEQTVTGDVRKERIDVEDSTLG